MNRATLIEELVSRIFHLVEEGDGREADAILAQLLWNVSDDEIMKALWGLSRDE